MIQLYFMSMSRLKKIGTTISSILSIWLFICYFFNLYNYTFFIILPLILSLNIYFKNKDFNENTELYHFLSGNNYATHLIQKTLALALHVNIQYIAFEIIVSIVKYFLKKEISCIYSLNSFLVFNSGLFITFMIGDIVRLSDVNKLNGGLRQKIIEYLVFSSLFTIIGGLYFLYKENILLHLSIMGVVILLWYLNCKRYTIIIFKQLIIPSIYDKN